MYSKQTVTNKMAASKRKREVQDVCVANADDLSPFVVQGCGFRVKRRRTVLNFSNDENKYGRSFDNQGQIKTTGDKSTLPKPQPLRWKGTLRRRISSSIQRQKLTQLQDYSLTCQSSMQQLRSLDEGRRVDCVIENCRENFEQDRDLQQKIDHEIRMREGTAKLLAASKHPAQLLEASKNLLASNTRIITYMTELQKRKTAEVLGKNTSVEGSQLPCKAKISVSDIRIPLMWKNTDHFKNKGDYRRYAVFCILKIGTEIYDTSMIGNVDRSMTDITFDDVVLFNKVSHDFDCKLEIYCHKLHEDLTIASTPKKIRKKINDLSGSVGRSVGKRLSGLNDADIIGNMVLGPRFELVATGSLSLTDVADSVRTFDLVLESNSDAACELPLFGHYCCRVAALPACLVEPAVTGFLNLQEDDDLSKWKRYWCVLKNLQLACWSAEGDVDVLSPLLTIPVTKDTQISDADPRTCKQSHTFHLCTVNIDGILEHTLAADSAEDLSKWWDGFQQHLLDQALWKQACDQTMEIHENSPHRLHPYVRKGSIYDNTPIQVPESLSDKIVGDLKMDASQLNSMLDTLIGEAQQIRGHSSNASQK